MPTGGEPSPRDRLQVGARREGLLASPAQDRDAASPDASASRSRVSVAATSSVIVFTGGLSIQTVSMPGAAVTRAL